MEGISRNQVFIDRLVWETVGSPTQGNALLDVYLVLPKNALVSCSTVRGISEQCGV
jgi:hypothetical protein